MKVLVNRLVAEDIGPLDGVLRLPTAARKRNGQQTKCVVCDTEIDSDYFLAGFKGGLPNMIICEECIDQQGLMLLAQREGEHGEWARDRLRDIT